MQPHFAAVIDVLSHHKISQISFLRSDAYFDHRHILVKRGDDEPLRVKC